MDGQHNRSYPGRPWPRVPSVRDPHQFPEPGAHGRIADGGGPGPRLIAHIRWSAAFDSDRRRAVCKTVGSAYVGSNPTPATTCENGPLAADTRQAGRFLLVTPCIVVRHRESMRCGVHGRIADGVHAIRTDGRCAPSAFPRTATDGPRWRRVSRLDARRRVGHASLCARRRPGWFPGTRGGTGKANALMTKAVRESVTMAGRAERARVARVFTAGVLGPGHPCGDDAALLVSCSATASGTAARARRGRRSRSGPPAAWSGSTSPTAAAGECRSCGPPVMRRKVSGGWVGPAWDARPAAARPQSHGAALGSQHPWLRHCAPEAPASRAPGPSTGRSGE